MNNWDLVDLTAPTLVGAYLADKDRMVLGRLSRSRNLWERRIAVVSTFAFIRTKDFKDAFRIADRLIGDREDLIHKATGWMLREIGKRDRRALDAFLRVRCQRMPRTMLRYAIGGILNACVFSLGPRRRGSTLGERRRSHLDLV